MMHEKSTTGVPDKGSKRREKPTKALHVRCEFRFVNAVCCYARIDSYICHGNTNRQPHKAQKGHGNWEAGNGRYNKRCHCTKYSCTRISCYGERDVKYFEFDDYWSHFSHFLYIKRKEKLSVLIIISWLC